MDGIWRPLNAPDAIRLLKLCIQTGDQHDSLEGELIETDLSSSPQYDCISYTWGDETPVASIRLNNNYGSAVQSVPVAQNLHEVLEHLRDERHERFIWLDALCISQRDTREKAHQVSIIGKIFTSAESVISWLGLSTSCSHHLLQGMLEEQPDLTKIDDLRSCFEDVLLREYWSRTWIVQEVILNDKVEVRCGASRIAWEPFFEQMSELCELYRESTKTHKNLALARGFFKLVGHRRRDFRKPATHELNDSICAILLDVCDTRCKDPLDHVYAVLSLEKQKSWQKAFRIDYTISPLDLFFEIFVQRAEQSWEELGELAPEIIAGSLRLIASDAENVAQEVQASNMKALADGLPAALNRIEDESTARCVESLIKAFLQSHESSASASGA